MTSDTRALKNGRITLESVLKDPESCSLGRLQVYALLSKAPKLGKKGAKKVLLHAGIWPLDRVRDIDLYQREEIIKALPPRVR